MFLSLSIWPDEPLGWKVFELDLEIAAVHLDVIQYVVEAPQDIHCVMSADVARGHGGDGGGDDRPPPYQVPTGCGGCLGNRGKGTRKPNLGGRRAGRPHTRQETRNLGLKAITDKSGPGVALALPFLAPNVAGAEGGGRGKDWGKHSLTCVPNMEITTAGHKLYGASSSDCKKINNGKKAAHQKERYWCFLKSEGTYDWSDSARKFPQHFEHIDSSVEHLMCPTLRMRSWPLFAGASSGGTFPVLDGSDDKFSQMLNQLESQPEYGGGSGNGGCGNDEPGVDEDGGEDEEDEDDS
ncbi:hypothetical protein Tco_0435751 [Tanacetum coccineum]